MIPALRPGCVRQIWRRASVATAILVDQLPFDSAGDFLMRRRPKIQKLDSTQKANLGKQFDATLSIRELQERVTRLERAFENGVAPLDYAAQPLPTEERKRPGPKPIHLQVLRSDRDTLVQMLENYWPELEPFCCPKPRPKSIRAVLEAIPSHQTGWYGPAAKQLLKHFDVFVRFLSTDRFRRDPRQIANALAGIPAVGIWRSLKLCQANPSNYPIGNRAIKSYIRRRHPELLQQLIADYSLPNFVTALRKYRTKDQKLASFGAQYLYQSWRDCQPNYGALGLKPNTNIEATKQA
jgi:hypothetical protein